MNYFCLEDYEQKAQAQLDPIIYDFFAGGADQETTLQANYSAFNQIKLRPRILKQFDNKLHINLLDHRIASPIIIAPTAFHCLAHPHGEVATAKAVHQAGTLMIISMAATKSMEDIIGSVEKKNFWFQLYIQSDRVFTKELILRAEQASCQALVVSVDSPVLGRRQRDRRNGFHDLPDGLVCPHLIRHGMTIPDPIEFNPRLSWQDIDWLQSVTKLPVVLKGILHPEDATIALEHNVSALIVSNHGGRQLDTVAASIELLPAIAEIVNNKIPLIIDGGIRRGTDILKAIALGAKAVAIGRPVIWGLAVAGQQGVKSTLDLLTEELIQALILCGCISLETITKDILLMP